MKSNYRKLGEFIRQVDVRNTDGKEENLLGVSVQKVFIPSIANTVGTDFTKYKVVKKGQFTYIPDTSRRGDKIGIALLEDYEEGLVSNVYTVFEIIDEKQLLPEYLMLWFRRPAFDRYARFKSHGSVREVMDWEEMCNVELPVPDVSDQRIIIEAYKIVEDRINLKQKINDSLDSIIYVKFQEMFQNQKKCLFSGNSLDGWSLAPLSDLASFKYGKMVPVENICKTGFPIYSGYRVVGYCNKYMFKEPQLVVLARGVSGTGEVRISPPCCHLTNLSIAVLLNDRVYMNYLLYYLENDNLISLDSGSAQSQITINDLSVHKIMIPPYDKVLDFENFAKVLLEVIDDNNKEIKKLEELIYTMLTTLSSR